MYSYLKSAIPEKYRKHVVYLFVGGTAFVADNGLFAVLFRVFDIRLGASIAASMFTGFLISFYGNKLLVFRSATEKDEHSDFRQLFYYLLLLAFNTVASYLFVRTVSQVFDYPIVLKVIAAVTIVLWNFTIYKKLIFRKKQEPIEEE